MQHLRNRNLRTPPNLHTIMQNLYNNTKRKEINLFTKLRVLDHSIHNRQHINLHQENFPQRISKHLKNSLEPSIVSTAKEVHTLRKIVSTRHIAGYAETNIKEERGRNVWDLNGSH